MQSAFFLFASVGTLIVGVACVFTVAALRRAPEGVETNAGLEVVDNVVPIAVATSVASTEIHYTETLAQAA